MHLLVTDLLGVYVWHAVLVTSTQSAAVKEHQTKGEPSYRNIDILETEFFVLVLSAMLQNLPRVK